MAETAVASPTVESSAATPEVSGPAQGPQTTASVSGGDAGNNGQGTAPVEPTFYSGDPNTLPPQLQEPYKNMLRDYKEKTARLAEESKKFRVPDDLKAKADLYDQLAQDQRFVKYWTGDQAQQNQTQQQEQIVTDEELLEAQTNPQKFMELVQKVATRQNTELVQKQQEIERKQLEYEAAEIIDAFADAKSKDGKDLRPDFDRLDQMGLIQFYLDKNPPQTKEQWDKAIASAYESAKKLYSDIYTEGRSAALQTIEQKSVQSIEKPSTGGKEGYNGPAPEKLSVAEAVALARKGIKVPR